MPELLILVGPPGCGKSTRAKYYIEDGVVRVNQDEQGKQGHMDIFESSLLQKFDIVVDRMNFNKEQRKRYIEPAKAAGYNVIIEVMHESYETCLSRCKFRENHETIKTTEDAKKALDFFFKNYERPTVGEADLTFFIYPSGPKPSAIICDLDGTLCNIDHRLHWVRNEGKKNWPMFFAGIKDDSVNTWCKDILQRCSDEHEIILCSGRGDELKESTIDWLSKHGIRYDKLLMRKAGDHRTDYIVKEIILDFEILTRYTPYFMIDDRQQVVDMWRKRGFTCLQCAKGDF